MIDFLYVLGSGSEYNNLELRLSLRSIDKYALNLGRVFVIGEKPDWIKNVVHIPVNDDLTSENNVFKKILIACKSGISENFVFMNDDFFMLNEFNAETYPYFINGDVKYIENPSRYQMVLNNSIVYLQSKGIEDVLDFRVHCPIRYNRKKFLSLESVFNQQKDKESGYSPRILYGNLFVDEYIEAPDCKIWGNEFCETEQRCISTKNDGIDVLVVLLKKFKKKSKYEKKDVDI